MDSGKARINVWLDWFSKFDLQLVYRPSMDKHIDLINGLSQIPVRLMDEPKLKDLPERLAMSTTISLEIQSAPL